MWIIAKRSDLTSQSYWRLKLIAFYRDFVQGQMSLSLHVENLPIRAQTPVDNMFFRQSTEIRRQASLKGKGEQINLSYRVK